jgi:hypothetical protein
MGIKLALTSVATIIVAVCISSLPSDPGAPPTNRKPTYMKAPPTYHSDGDSRDALKERIRATSKSGREFSSREGR